MIHAKVHITGGGVLTSVCAHSLNHSLFLFRGGLSRFTGMGGIVRKVLSKPGIWHYQGVVTLSNGDPLLLDTRTHNTSPNLGEST